MQLVYGSPDHVMSVRQVGAALHWSAKLVSATGSELSSRNLLKYEKCTLTVPREIVDKLVRGQGVFVAPGKMFYGPADGPRVDQSAFATLRLERPRIDPAQLALEVARLKGLKKRQQASELDAVARALGIPRSQIELMLRPVEQVVKNAERNAIQEAAKQRWRDDYHALLDHPDQLPVRKKLWEDARQIPGMTRQMFRDVISEMEPGRPGPRPLIRAKKSENSGAN